MDKFFYALKGVYFGYSKESIHAFAMRDQDDDNGTIDEFTPTSEGTPFDGTGFIPSEREVKLGWEAVTSEVNSRRICKAPFPFGTCPEEELMAFADNLTSEQRARIREVLQYLQENTYESYLRALAGRRSRSQLPA